MVRNAERLHRIPGNITDWTSPGLALFQLGA